MKCVHSSDKNCYSCVSVVRNNLAFNYSLISDLDYEILIQNQWNVLVY